MRFPSIKTSLMLTMIFMVNILFAPNKLYASHLAAADLFVTYIGAGADGCSNTTEYKYEVSLKIYRACERNSGTLGNTDFYRYGSVTAGVNVSRNVSNPRKDTMDQLCDVFKSTNSCRVVSNQQYPGFICHTYLDTITLPSAQTDWVFSWNGNARNAGIDNIATTAGGTQPQGSIYIEAGLNNLTKYNNSTPRFDEPALPYICVNQPSTYLNRPSDPNNDSLRIYGQTPLAGANTPYFYRTDGGRTYSALDPVGSVPGTTYYVDSFTGAANFTAANPNKVVLAFRCDEYERGTGIPLGYTMRDVQISMFACADPPPSVDSLPLELSADFSIVDIGGRKGIIACPGTNIKFNISSKSNNPSGVVVMREQFSHPHLLPSFTSNGQFTSSVVSTFEWTPGPNDIGEYTLTINTID
jgi:hypothetical protein